MASLPPTAPQAALKYQPVPTTGADQPPPHSAAVNYGSSPPSAKVSLATWWEKFKKKPAAVKEGGDKDHPSGIFGVPLSKSIKYANVAISLTDGNGEQFIYGYVPIVVAKCGVFLKEKATNVEGIFRLSGSAKRIKDLQTIFNSPDKYGKGLDWAGYTVHDAANIFRRYLNQLPEPIIPLDFYARFREPLQCAPEHFDAHAAIRAYQDLIGKLPALNRQLLLYILDLLAVFASKSEQNLMNASNLAAIFQPGLINHPEHDMSPSDYKLSQDVLVFLITNQDHFLLGMRGNTENDVVDNLNVPLVPASPASPRRAKTVISRSPSNSSAGADDVRKYGNLRRNVSVTSKRSTTGSPIVPSSGGGLSRSNTLPSKRSPAVSPVTFRGDHTPTPGSPRSGLAPEKSSITRSPSVGGRVRENVTPVSTTSEDSVKTVKPMIAPPRTGPPPRMETEIPLAQPQPVTTPIKERNFANFFAGLSPEPHDRPQRTGNKLRKQRRPGSTTHSADSSTTNLGEANTSNAPIQNGHGPPPTSHPPVGDALVPASQPSPVAPTTSMLQYFGISQQGNAPHSAASSATLMPAMSPTPSTTSSVTSQSSSHEYSDTTNPSSSPEKKKRSRWRLSGQKFDNPPTSPTFANGHNSTGSLAERIRAASRSPPHRTRSVSGEASGMSDNEEKRSTFGWLSKKVNERKQYHQQSEKEREHREHERPRGRDEMHVSVDNLPKIPMPLPGSPRVQPPTPSSVSLPTTSTQTHHAESFREREANPFRWDRQTKQRNAPMHVPAPMHSSVPPPVPMHNSIPIRPSVPMHTPRTSEERERVHMREGHSQNREGGMKQQKEIQDHNEGQTPKREIPVHQREGQIRPRETPINQRDGQMHQREIPVNQSESQVHQREIPVNQTDSQSHQREIPVDQREPLVHQRRVSAPHRDISVPHREISAHHRDVSAHKREGPELPLYAPVPGESIEPESQIQPRRRPQAIRPGEPISLEGIILGPSGRISQGMHSNPTSPGPMSPPGSQGIHSNPMSPGPMSPPGSQGMHGNPMSPGPMSPPGTAL